MIHRHPFHSITTYVFSWIGLNTNDFTSAYIAFQFKIYFTGIWDCYNLNRIVLNSKIRYAISRIS